MAQYIGVSRQMFPRPYAPFDTGLAEQHDRVTAADPLARIDDPLARDFLDAFVATCVGNRARESAWVEMVRWYALAGHNYFDHVEALGALSLPRRHEGADRRDASRTESRRCGSAPSSPASQQDGARARR